MPSEPIAEIALSLKHKPSRDVLTDLQNVYPRYSRDQLINEVHYLCPFLIEHSPALRIGSENYCAILASNPTIVGKFYPFLRPCLSKLTKGKFEGSFGHYAIECVSKLEKFVEKEVCPNLFTQILDSIMDDQYRSFQERVRMLTPINKDIEPEVTDETITENVGLYLSAVSHAGDEVEKRVKEFIRNIYPDCNIPLGHIKCFSLNPESKEILKNDGRCPLILFKDYDELVEDED